MASITFNGQMYRAISTVAQADIALAPSELNEAWSALTPEVKAARLIQASRTIWSYADWRGVTGDGSPTDQTAMNQRLACARIAATMPKGQTPAQAIRRAELGPMSVEFSTALVRTERADLDQEAVRLLDVDSTLVTVAFGSPFADITVIGGN